MACPTVAELAALLDRLHRHKTKGYRDAWRRRGEVLSIFANIARKFDRLEVALGHGVASKDERLIDTVADLCVYTGKYLTWLAEQQPAAFEGADGSPAAAECSDARGPAALRSVLDEMVKRGENTAPSMSATWSRIRTDFGLLERGLMEQAHSAAGVGLTWTAKVEVAWDLLVSSGLMAIVLAEDDPAGFAAWVSEVDAMASTT